MATSVPTVLGMAVLTGYMIAYSSQMCIRAVVNYLELLFSPPSHLLPENALLVEGEGKQRAIALHEYTSGSLKAQCA